MFSLLECEGSELVVPRPITTASWARQFCGVESLYMIMVWGEREAISLEQLEDMAELGPAGVSVQGIVDLAANNGVKLVAITNADWDDLVARELAILHVDDSHFIAFAAKTSDECYVFDSASGLWEMNRYDFLKKYRWHGIAIVEHSKHDWFAMRLLKQGWTTCFLVALSFWVFAKGRILPFGRPSFNF